MPSIDFSQAPLWLQWIIIGTVVLGGLVGIIQFIRKGWPVLVRFVNTINALAELPKFIQESEDWRVKTDTRLDSQDRTLGAIKHEVEYNNGSSVKDAIKRVEEGVAGLYAANPELVSPESQKPQRRRKPPAKKENP